MDPLLHLTLSLSALLLDRTSDIHEIESTLLDW